MIIGFQPIKRDRLRWVKGVKSWVAQLDFKGAQIIQTCDNECVTTTRISICLCTYVDRDIPSLRYGSLIMHQNQPNTEHKPSSPAIRNTHVREGLYIAMPSITIHTERFGTRSLTHSPIVPSRRRRPRTGRQCWGDCSPRGCQSPP